MKKTKLSALLLASFLMLTGCGGGTTSVVPVGVSISSVGNVTALEVDKTLQLTAVVHPEDAVQTVAWSTSDLTLATVSSQGLVTALKTGNIFVTATSTEDAAIKNDFALTLTPKEIPVVNPSSITLSTAGDVLEVEVDAKLQLSAVVLPAGVSQRVLWTSANEEFATVNPDGMVTGRAPGSVAITATALDHPTVKASLTLEVKEATPPETTVDWAELPFASHDDYWNSELGGALRIKGKVSHLAPVDENGKVSYYLQNGKDGYAIYQQDATIFPVEFGKVYEVGGFKEVPFPGPHNLINIQYFKEISEVIDYVVTDVSAFDMYDDLLMDTYQDSWVEINGWLIDSVPTTIGEKAFSYNVIVDGNKMAFRVDPKHMTADEFSAISLKFAGTEAGSVLSAKGILGKHGYGRLKIQLLVMNAADFEVTPAGGA